MSLTRILLCAVLAISVPAGVAAGTLITIQEERLGKIFTSNLYLQDGNLRVEQAGQERTVIYRADNGFFWMLDPVAKTYRKLGRLVSSEAQRELERVRQQLEDRKDLSGAEKKQILDSLAPRTGSTPGGVPAAPPPTTFRKVASGVGVNGYVTDEYELIQIGEKLGEIWQADPKALNVDPADIALLRPRFWSDWGESAPAGVPVRAILYSGGRKVSVIDMTSVSHKDMPASIFELPKDFKPGPVAASPGGTR
jgi:hypothetical protein